MKARETPLVVAGAGGRLGRALGRIWAGRDDIVWQSRSKIDRPGAVALDPIAEPGRLRDLLGGAGAFLCLWSTTPSGGGDPALNAVLARRAFTAVREAGCPRAVFISSSAVYGPGDEPFAENAQIDPPSVYGRSKHEAEKVIEAAAKDGCAWTILRLANVAGADSLPLFGQGPVTLDRLPAGHAPVRSYATPALLARVIDMTLADDQSPPCRILNVAYPDSQSMDALLAAAGRDWNWRPAPPNVQARLTLDVSRLSAELPGLRPAGAARIVAEARAAFA